MAVNFDEFRPPLDSTEYVSDYYNFIGEMEAWAQEIEDAREGSGSLLINLQTNYAKYSLVNDLDGQTITGTATGASTSTTLIASTPHFTADMVGRTAYNVTDDESATITIWNSTTNVTTTAVTSWANDEYQIGFKLKNMQAAEDPLDYITKSQADSIVGGGISYITDLSPGILGANDIIVVGTDGLSITGRPTAYTTITSVSHPNPLAYNGNYNFDVSSSFSVNLPVGIIGGVIGLADLNGTVGPTNTLTIIPNGTERIMGGQDTIVINEYTYISFKLVYANASVGWVFTELQR